MKATYAVMKLSELKHADYNPRKVSKLFDKQLEKSIDKFGLVLPLVYNKQTGNIVGGHQRARLLQQKGVDEVVVAIVDLPLKDEKILNIGLNKITGDWDSNKLQQALNSLASFDYDLSNTGFRQNEIDNIMARYVPDFELKEQTVDVHDGIQEVIVSQSHIRMVMLFFKNKQEHETFSSYITILSKRYKKENLTDVVTEVINRAHNNLQKYS